MIQNSENQSENQMFNFSSSGLVNEEKGENPKAGSIEVSGWEWAGGAGGVGGAGGAGGLGGAGAVAGGVVAGGTERGNEIRKIAFVRLVIMPSDWDFRNLEDKLMVVGGSNILWKSPGNLTKVPSSDFWRHGFKRRQSKVTQSESWKLTFQKMVSTRSDNQKWLRVAGSERRFQAPAVRIRSDQKWPKVEGWLQACPAFAGFKPSSRCF